MRIGAQEMLMQLRIIACALSLLAGACAPAPAETYHSRQPFMLWT